MAVVFAAVRPEEAVVAVDSTAAADAGNGFNLLPNETAGSHCCQPFFIFPLRNSRGPFRRAFIANSIGSKIIVLNAREAYHSRVSFIHEAGRTFGRELQQANAEARGSMKPIFMRRNLLGVLMGLVAGVAALSFLAPDLSAQSAPSPMAGKTAGEYYKNVILLKDIPAGDLLPTMEYISAAVGIPCGGCHTTNHFESDDKRNKNSARNMMKLTFALDDTLFKGRRQITCYTCHRGGNSPAMSPELPGETVPRERTARATVPTVLVPNLTVDSTMGTAPPVPPGGPPPGGAAPGGNPGGTSSGSGAPPAAAFPSVDDVLAKYAQALGGDAAIQRVSSLSEKGTVETLAATPPGTPGAPTVSQYAAEVYRKSPDKVITITHLPAAISEEAYDGSIGWRQTGANGREDTGGALAVLKSSAEIFPGLRAKENYTGLVVDASEKIGDRDAFRVIGQRPNGLDRLYFDAQSGLLLRLWTTMDTPLGSIPQEMNFEDYRAVNGVMIPFTIRIVAMTGDRTYKWDQVVVNAPVEDKIFAQPPPGTAAAPSKP